MLIGTEHRGWQGASASPQKLIDFVQYLMEHHGPSPRNSSPQKISFDSGRLRLRGGLTLFQLFVQGRELVLHLPHFVLRESLFLLPILDLLLILLVRQLDLLLHVDDIPGRIADLLLFLVASARVLLCSLFDGLALLLEKAGLHDPLLSRDRATELLVVGDDDHAT